MNIAHLIKPVPVRLCPIESVKHERISNDVPTVNIVSVKMKSVLIRQYYLNKS